MTKEKLQIILDAIWRGKSAVQQADKDVGRLGKGIQKIQANWQKLAVGAGIAATAVVAVGAAAKVAFGELERGAALTQAAGQFDRLTESIGSTSDAMLVRLEAAGRGMVSTANLISGANEIMSGKLAKTEDGVVRLSAAAGALNVDMGLLAQTINNQSILRLDNMGVAAEDVIPKFNALKDAGVGVKEAFTEALTEALEAKVTLLGEASDTTAGQILMLKKAWDDARDALSIGFAEGAADEIKLLGENAELSARAFNEAGNFWGRTAGVVAANIFLVDVAVAELDQALKAGVITQYEYRDALIGVESRALGVGKTLEWIEGKQKDFTAATGKAAFSLADIAAEASGADRAMLQYAGSVVVATGATRDLTGAVAQLAFAEFGPFPAPPMARTELLGNVPSGRNLFDIRQDELRAESFFLRPSFEVAEEQAGGYFTTVTDGLTDADKLARALEGTTGDITGATGGLASGFSGVASAVSSAAEEMAALDAATGSLFAQARKMTELDPAEFFFEQALQFGASADKLREVLVGSGLSSVEEADAIFARFKQLESLKAGAAAFAAQDGISFEQAFAGGGGIAAGADFSGASVDQSRTVVVGGITIIIEGNATNEEIQMGIDNAMAQVFAQEGVEP